MNIVSWAFASSFIVYEHCELGNEPL